MHDQTLNFISNRNTKTHKFDYGHVLVFGGSPGMVGAPLLSAEAALRVGAGLVTLASSSDVVDKLEKRVREVMTLRVPKDSIKAAKLIEKFVADRKVNVFVVGPGISLGMSDAVAEILKKINIPTIVDGGAIQIVSPMLDSISKRKKIILTPHTGEFARIAGGNQSNLNEVAMEFAKKHKVILVLKSDRTKVIDSHGIEYVNNIGNPGMATAGSGDVLSGVIGGLIAQGLDVTNAARLGTYIHSLAGDIAAEEKTQAGLIASDIISYIPKALSSIDENN